MPERSITQLDPLTGAEIDSADLFHLVDVSEADVAKKNKYITQAELINVFGNPYFKTSHTGTLPIAIDGIAIGENSEVNLYSAGIAVGAGAKTLASNDEEPEGYDAIALGNDAICSEADQAIQLGRGSNSKQRTLQYLDTTIATYLGIVAPIEDTIPEFIYGDGALVIDSSDNSFNYRVGFEWFKFDPNAGNAGGEGEPYLLVNSTGTLPLSTGNNTSAILLGENTSALGSIAGLAAGRNAYIQGSEALAIGSDTRAEGIGAAAVGSNSQAKENGAASFGENSISEAINGIQLGAGTNTNNSTLQFRSRTIANNDGIEAPVISGTPTNTPRDGSIAVDNTSGAEKLWIRVNSTWKSVVLN